MKNLKSADLSRYAPPGVKLRQDFQFLGVMMGISFLWSLSFWYRYLYQWRNTLFWSNHGFSHEYTGAPMLDFVVLLTNRRPGGGGSDCLLFYFLSAVLMLFLIFRNYSTFYSGSRSIYLMKRLPDRWELLRRCVTVPLLCAAVCLLCALLTMTIYFVLYLLITPAQCLQPDQLGKLLGLVPVMIYYG